MIPDVFDDSIEFQEIIEKKEGYCFTGGMNNRDWVLLMKIAQSLPSIRFVCVALEEDFHSQVQSVPNNVDVYFNVDVDTYYSMMRESYLVLMPLRDDKVAGLINITHSAQYGIPCCITNTPAARQYYPDEFFLMDNTVESWVSRIKYMFECGFPEYKEITKMFQMYVKTQFSPDAAVEKLLSIISNLG